jgi:hypothetical protein
MYCMHMFAEEALRTITVEWSFNGGDIRTQTWSSGNSRNTSKTMW